MPVVRLGRGAVAILVTFVAFLLFVGCGPSSDEGSAPERTGTLQAKLVGTSSSGITFRLHGHFDVRDAAGKLVTTLNADVDPSATVLTASLPEGDYFVILANGWSMERVDTGDTVDAILGSDQVVPTAIRADQTTTVVYEFLVYQETVAIGGDLAVSINVDVCGDGIQSIYEQCDDGNLEAGDGCGPTCLREFASFVITPDGRHVGYLPAVYTNDNSTFLPVPPRGTSFPIAETGTPASVDDACSPLAAGSLTGRFALVRRGGCTFHMKAENVQAAGAAGLILYDNLPGSLVVTPIVEPSVTIPVVHIRESQGLAIHTFLAAAPVQVTWTSDWIASP